MSLLSLFTLRCVYLILDGIVWLSACYHFSLLDAMEAYIVHDICAPMHEQFLATYCQADAVMPDNADVSIVCCVMCVLT